MFLIRLIDIIIALIQSKVISRKTLKIMNNPITILFRSKILYYNNNNNDQFLCVHRLSEIVNIVIPV